MSFVTKSWILGEVINSTDLNRMENGISTAVTHSTSTGSIHGITNLVGTTETQSLTGKSVSSSTDYLTSLIRNAVISTSTGATTAAGDMLYVYVP
jgi:hypothetical protein